MASLLRGPFVAAGLLCRLRWGGQLWLCLALWPSAHVARPMLMCWLPPLLCANAAPVHLTVDGQTDEDLLHLLAYDTGTCGASRTS